MSSTEALPFVLEGVRIAPRPLPIAPEICLYLMQDDYPDQSLAETDYTRLMTAPPYWAFCWGGGQALARWILDHPDQVRGRSVVDFGAGSGVAGVAAGIVGAAQVLCVDIDADALRACHANAGLNDVVLTTGQAWHREEGVLLLAADVCYEEEGFAEVMEHMAAGADVIVAESRLRDLSQRFPRLRLEAQYQVRTFPDLEESENYDTVHIYRSYQPAKIR